ncbi:hypothetical protein CDAR_619381 [Caerostris darwini]|uniref:Uncharacterized protein n=1 Tax=Caerostris darwini TaxID=1538125 RepID=A0AAV4PW12_9ARAC|nr:hypothetical protein CDAR_619381 [Caerostris darwini]
MADAICFPDTNSIWGQYCIKRKIHIAPPKGGSETENSRDCTQHFPANERKTPGGKEGGGRKGGPAKQDSNDGRPAGLTPVI